jgi:hypothetical protein
MVINLILSKYGTFKNLVSCESHIAMESVTRAPNCKNVNSTLGRDINCMMVSGDNIISNLYRYLYGSLSSLPVVFYRAANIELKKSEI